MARLHNMHVGSGKELFWRSWTLAPPRLIIIVSG